jgi:hypothetical protein
MRALVVLAFVLGPAHAFAEDQTGEAPVFASVGAGVVLALGSLATGGLVLATHEDTASRKAGNYTVLYGVALAPIVSHSVAAEWGRAALFGMVPVASVLAATWLIESSPGLLVDGSLGKRRVLTACYSLTLLSAAIGLYDSMSAGERTRPRHVALAPVLGRGELGVAVGGVM